MIITVLSYHDVSYSYRMIHGMVYSFLHKWHLLQWITLPPLSQLHCFLGHLVRDDWLSVWFVPLEGVLRAQLHCDAGVHCHGDQVASCRRLGPPQPGSHCEWPGRCTATEAEPLLPLSLSLDPGQAKGQPLSDSESDSLDTRLGLQLWAAAT